MRQSCSNKIDAHTKLSSGRDLRYTAVAGCRVPGAAHQTITAMVGAAILIVGGLATIDGSMTIGTVLSFFAGFALLRGPLTAMNKHSPT